jgi:hypothetical protein
MRSNQWSRVIWGVAAAVVIVIAELVRAVRR